MNRELKERIQRIVNGFSYKPGSRLEFRMDKFAVIFRVTVLQPKINGNDYTLQYPVVREKMVDYLILEYDKDLVGFVKYIVFGLITDIELHERDEHLKFNGVHYNVPHLEER